jgi:hypothetical protein
MNTEEKIEKLANGFRDMVLDGQGKLVECNRKLSVERNITRSLRKRLEAYCDEEMTEGEIFLVDKIERLEDEIKEKDEYILSLTGGITVEKSEVAA